MYNIAFVLLRDKKGAYFIKSHLLFIIQMFFMLILFANIILSMFLKVIYKKYWYVNMSCIVMSLLVV